MKPVHECWLAASPEMLPIEKALSPDEVQEARRLFFVGALCLWQMRESFKDLPPEHLARFEAALKAELAVFRATVGTPIEGMV